MDHQDRLGRRLQIRGEVIAVKSKLFWQLFWAFLATLLATVLMMGGLMVAMVRSERQAALEAEVLTQARDMARLLRQIDSILFGGRYDTTLDWKLREIQGNYGATVWIVSGNAQRVIILDGENAQSQASVPEAKAQIQQVLGGSEIRVRGLIRALGDDIVTIGVPTTNAQDEINGAVLLHISVASLQVDFRDVVRYVMTAAVFSMLLGAAMAYFISRRQTTPLRRINRAVSAFAKGKLSERVLVKGNDEIAQLADAFNTMAEDLSNLEMSRRSFVANVSHELRSPLTCISGYVQGMLDGTIQKEDYGKYLWIVRAEADRLSKLTNELLDLSKLESGKFSLEMTRFDLNELLSLELLKFEQRIDEKRLEVEVDFPEAPCYVLADADRIRQVVTNLIDNAVKFSREGDWLKLLVRSGTAQCEVSIANGGEAIDPADIPFLFDPFYKVDKAHTSGMGTGLGLSIVERILAQHGEKITVQSDVTGTAFTFTLHRASEK